MKANLIPVVIATLLLSLIPVNANPAPVSVDNTFTFGGTFGLVNPCNSELVTGNITIRIVVTTTQTGNGETKVNVHHSSHGLLTGNQGNEYQISRIAKGQFDAISNEYIIPWRGEFVGKGDAPNFSADATLRVFTNANNEPVGSQGLLPVVRTCNQP
jgi:hypothetical protein